VKDRCRVLCQYDTTDFDDVKQLLYTAKAVSTGRGIRRRLSRLSGYQALFASLDTAFVAQASVSYKFDERMPQPAGRLSPDDYSQHRSVEHDVSHRNRFVALISATIYRHRRARSPGRRPDESSPWGNVQVGFREKLDFGDAPKRPPQVLRPSPDLQ